LRLLIEPTAAAEVAAVGVWYDRGSRDESDLDAGATHFVEHMLFKGTSTRSAASIARRIDALGGAVNAFTEREAMALHAVVPGEAFSEAAEILCDLVMDARFDADDMEKERTVIENEIEAADDDPEEAAGDAFSRRLWGAHPVARKIGGEAAAVRAIHPDRVRGWFENYFQGRATVISVAGSVDPDQVADVFLRIASRGRRCVPTVQPQRTPPPASDSTGQSYQVLQGQYVQLFYGLQGQGRLPQDLYYPLAVADAAIGDSMGSRLFQDLREQRGLCYSVYSTPTLLSDASLWTAYATSSIANAGELNKRMGDLIRQIAAQGLEAHELTTAKAHVKGMIKIASQDTEYHMRRIAWQALSESPLLTCAQSIEKIEAVTADEAGRAMDWFFKSKPVIFAVGPKSGRRAFNG